MNAPATAAAIAEPTLQMIALTKLTPSDTHIQEMRRARFDKKTLEELAGSIKKVGILQPIVARPQFTVRVQKSDVGDLWYPETLNIAGEWNAQTPCKSEAEAEKAAAKIRDAYEIVAGERRFLAAKLAGFKEVPVTVRPLSDEQVLEVQLIENLQREGLHELEEAEGYEELMKLKKINADALGDMVGKSRSYVYARLKLLALCPEARKAFYAGELDASRALLIARIGHHDTQRQALKDVLTGPHQRNDGPMSYREAHRHIIENYMLQLKSAPFDVNDANLLPKAGTCTACPKRTGNQRDLFGDVKSADVCTDPKCFDDKRQAHYAAPRKQLEAAGKKVIYGDAAKKLFHDWDSPNAWARDRMAGGQYVGLDETTYAVSPSRKVSALLGDDYEPILIQHPGSGKIFKVATQQALAAAAAAKQKERQKNRSSSGSARTAPAAKPEEPDIEDLVDAAVVKAAHAKAPKALGNAELWIVAANLWETVVRICRQRAQSALGAAWGWEIKPGYSARPPKELDNLSAPDINRFIVDCLVVVGLERESGAAADMLKRLKIDRKAIKAQLIEEQKKAKDEARKKADAAKAPRKKAPAAANKKPTGKAKAKKK